ncbi:MAG: hypothetical protein IJR65_05540 [Oscillospiraceae bacterium]|nr:hypothetical protein [Oscillospiraceae bacterium]
MTPYGYRIELGRACPEPQAQARLLSLFRLCAAGLPLKACAAASGVPRCPMSCKRLLLDPVYLGTDFYPPLVPPELFAAAGNELRRRAAKRKPIRGRRRIPALPVLTAFTLLPPGPLPEDPVERFTAELARVVPEKGPANILHRPPNFACRGGSPEPPARRAAEGGGPYAPLPPPAGEGAAAAAGEGEASAFRQATPSHSIPQNKGGQPWEL